MNGSVKVLNHCDALYHNEEIYIYSYFTLVEIFKLELLFKGRRCILWIPYTHPPPPPYLNTQ